MLSQSVLKLTEGMACQRYSNDSSGACRFRSGFDTGLDLFRSRKTEPDDFCSDYRGDGERDVSKICHFVESFREFVVFFPSRRIQMIGASLW